MRTIVSAVLLTSCLFGAAEPSRGERVVLVAGGGDGGDGARADRARLEAPFGLGFGERGTLYFVEMTGQRVRAVGPDGLLRTVAGTGRKGGGGDRGPASRAEFNGMHALAMLGDRDVLVADTWNNRVRRIDLRSGRITTIAGTGRKGFSGDGGQAVAAEFGGIYSLAFDERRRSLYLADLDNRRVRRVDLESGLVSTVAGNGKKGVPRDGDDASSAPLLDPRAVALDGQGTLYILERAGNALRVVDHTGKIRTVAGTGKAGSSGDGGDALRATMNGPKHLCVDPKGDVVIADTENHRIRVYRPGTGTIVALAGTGRKGSAGVGGPPAEVELNQPHGVAIGPDGALYIADSSNNRVLKIVP